MKLPLLCSQCDIEEFRPVATVEFRDDGRYETMCPKGHRSITILQQQKFEVLFQIGAYAIADGYYREAVSSFASSLERFCEFFVRAVMLQEELKQETIDAAWKLVAAQSSGNWEHSSFCTLRSSAARRRCWGTVQSSSATT